MYHHQRTRQHKVWIDWMKAIGMFTIVWGHCFPRGGMDSFLYAFNVPLFFAISGYLTHIEEDMGVCWRKCWHNLIIPYFILAFIKCLGPMLKHIGDGQFAWSLFGIALGFHSINDMPSCNNLWFVYTLILIKLLHQVLRNRPFLLSLITIVFIVGALFYNYKQLEWKWGVTNVMLAWPFFLLGNICSQHFDEFFNSMISKILKTNKLLLLFSCVVLSLVIYQIGLVNGSASLYLNRYGDNFVLFVVGAVLGCLMILILSLICDSHNWRAIRIISSGSIIILVFHREFLHPMLKFVNNQELDVLLENVIVFIIALIATVAFIPIILIVKRWFPIVLGRRAMNI